MREGRRRPSLSARPGEGRQGNGRRNEGGAPAPLVVVEPVETNHIRGRPQ